MQRSSSLVLCAYMYFLQVDSVKKEIYVALNTSHLATLVTLPNRPGYRWEPFVDTSKPSPFDCITHDLPGRETAMKQYRHFLDANMYPMLSYSSIILLLSPIDDSWVCVIPPKVFCILEIYYKTLCESSKEASISLLINYICNYVNEMHIQHNIL